MKSYNEDIVQGVDDEGEYGYVGIDGRGGQFFQWRDSLKDTITTICDDVNDPPKSWSIKDYAHVRGVIRRNHRRVIDRQKTASHMFGHGI